MGRAVASVWGWIAGIAVYAVLVTDAHMGGIAPLVLAGLAGASLTAITNRSGEAQERRARRRRIQEEERLRIQVRKAAKDD